MRDRILQQLHETHLGISHMKSLARQYVWWSGVAADIEGRVRVAAVVMIQDK